MFAMFVQKQTEGAPYTVKKMLQENPVYSGAIKLVRVSSASPFWRHGYHYTGVINLQKGEMWLTSVEGYNKGERWYGPVEVEGTFIRKCLEDDL